MASLGIRTSSIWGIYVEEHPCSQDVYMETSVPTIFTVHFTQKRKRMMFAHKELSDAINQIVTERADEFRLHGEAVRALIKNEYGVDVDSALLLGFIAIRKGRDGMDAMVRFYPLGVPATGTDVDALAHGLRGMGIGSASLRRCLTSIQEHGETRWLHWDVTSDVSKYLTKALGYTKSGYYDYDDHISKLGTYLTQHFGGVEGKLLKRHTLVELLRQGVFGKSK